MTDVTDLTASTSMASTDLFYKAISPFTAGYDRKIAWSDVLASIQGNLGDATADSITWSDTTKGIVGTTTNDNAASGYVGEYKETIVLVGSAVSLTTSTPAQVAALSLEAGDWNVWGEVWLTGNSSTVITLGNFVICTSSAVIPTAPASNSSQTIIARPSSSIGTLGTLIVPVGACRQSLASTTSIYLNTTVYFSTSTCSAYGKICARRIR